MGDWIHCNKCSKKYTQQASFFLAECGHIFCQICVERMRASKTCLVCNKTGNVVPLNKDVHQSVLDYFSPMEDLFKKSLEVYKFQLQHRNTLHQNLLNKYNYVKKEYLNCYQSNKHLMKENQMLRSMLRAAGKNPQGFITSTPVCQPTDITFENTSMLSSIPPHMGITPSKDNSMPKMFSGHSKRNQFFNSAGSSQRSSVQRVPLYSQLQEPTMMNRKPMNVLRTIEEVRRSGKYQ